MDGDGDLTERSMGEPGSGLVGDGGRADRNGELERPLVVLTTLVELTLALMTVDVGVEGVFVVDRRYFDVSDVTIYWTSEPAKNQGLKAHLAFDWGFHNRNLNDVS